MMLCNKIEVESATENLDAAPPCARPNIWLVDDNGEYRGLLALLLAEEGGFECSREFSNPKTMLAALAKETPPDVILLDVQMGDECGLDAIEPIKALTSFTHVIMLTTCFDSLYRKRAEQSGATDFLLKSYSVAQIAQRVQKALEQPIPIVKTIEAAPSLVVYAKPAARPLFTEWQFATWMARMFQSASQLRSRLAMLF